MISFVSFFGLREIIGGSGLEALAVPAITAAGSGVLFWIAWHMLFRRLPRMEIQNCRTQVILIAAMITVSQTMYSAWPVATKVAGEAATTAHLSEHLTQARPPFERSFQAVETQRSLIGKVETKAAEYHAHSRLEVAGNYSGKAGNGSVAQAFDDAGSNLEKMKGQMGDALNNAQADKTAGLEILQRMGRLVADTSIPSDERQRQYADLTTRLADTVQSLNSADLTISLDGLVGGWVIRKQSITADQRATIDDVQRSVKLLAEDIKKEAFAMRKGDAMPQVPAFVPLSAGMAVVKYAADVPMGWGIALGLDILPFLLLVTAMLTDLERRERPYDQSSVAPGSDPRRPNPDSGTDS